MEQIIAPLVGYGPAGLAVALFALVSKRLFDLYVASQEKRIEEAGKYQTALADATGAIRELRSLVEGMSRGA